MINGIFDNTISVLQKSLHVRARKHEVTLSNIANADTPNYKAVELQVENELSENATSVNPDKLARTNPSHFPVAIHDTNSVKAAKIEISSEVTLRGDGNTVNIEKEMAELSENNFMYRASADLLSRKFQGLLNAIKGGRR